MLEVYRLFIHLTFHDYLVRILLILSNSNLTWNWTNLNCSEFEVTLFSNIWRLEGKDLPDLELGLGVYGRCQNGIWTTSCIGPKNFQDQLFLDLILGPNLKNIHILGGPNFYRAKNFQDPKFFKTQIFSGPKVFRDTNLFEPKYFATQIFFEPKYFKTHDFWDSNFSGLKFLKHKLFRDTDFQNPT